MFGNLFKSEEQQRRDLLAKDLIAYLDKYSDSLTKKVSYVEYTIRFVSSYSRNFTSVRGGYQGSVYSDYDNSISESGLLIFCEMEDGRCVTFPLPIKSLNGWYNNSSKIRFTDGVGKVREEVTKIYDEKLGKGPVHTYTKAVEYIFNRNMMVAQPAMQGTV